MKKAWLEHNDEVLAELHDLYRDHCPLTFCQHGGMAVLDGLREIIPRDGKETLLVLRRPEGFTVNDENFFIFYRRQGQSLLRGLQGYIVQQGRDFFLISFPAEIYKVQRRRHPRVVTPAPSSFSLSPRRSRRLIHGSLRNLSREGVLLEGDFTGMERGQEISPLTLNLYLENKQMEPVVAVISRARILRLEQKGEENWLASLQFWHQDSDQKAIDTYMEWRAMETVT